MRAAAAAALLFHRSQRIRKARIPATANMLAVWDQDGQSNRGWAQRRRHRSHSSHRVRHARYWLRHQNRQQHQPGAVGGCHEEVMSALNVKASRTKPSNTVGAGPPPPGHSVRSDRRSSVSINHRYSEPP